MDHLPLWFQAMPNEENWTTYQMVISHLVPHQQYYGTIWKQM